MENIKSKVSAGLFGIIIFCFFLPFVSISCAGQEVATLSAFQFVTGSNIQGQKIDPVPIALIAFIFAIVGLGLGFMKSERRFLLSMIMGIGGFLSTLMLKYGIEKAIQQQGYGFYVQFGSGYSMLLLLNLCAAVYNFYLAFLDKDREFQSHLYSNYKKTQLRESKFCEQCGAENEINNKYCYNCGKRIE